MDRDRLDYADMIRRTYVMAVSGLDAGSFGIITGAANGLVEIELHPDGVKFTLTPDGLTHNWRKVANGKDDPS